MKCEMKEKLDLTERGNYETPYRSRTEGKVVRRAMIPWRTVGGKREYQTKEEEEREYSQSQHWSSMGSKQNKEKTN